MSDFEKFLNNLGHENEHVEYKEAKNNFPITDNKDPHCIHGYCVALGNECGGFLVLGIDNNMQVVGTNFDLHKENLKEFIYEQTGQRIEVIEYCIDGKKVIAIDIPSRPVGKYLTFNKIPYMRVGQQLREMDQETIKKILNEGQVDWSGQVARGASFDDIDDVAVLIAKENFAIKHPNIQKEEIASWDKKTFLSKAKLLNDNKVTNAALILLGKEESKDLLSPAVAQISWILKDTNGEDLDYQHFFPPFIKTVNDLYAKIRNLKYRYMHGAGSLFPEEVDKYEPYVIREALNNCIAHQDYSKCSKITVVEKTDSLIFANDGYFIPKTIEAVIDTDTPPRYYRNRFLADAMVNLNMIDTVGSGIRRMFRYQRDRFFPLPTYDLSSEQVKVEIFGKVLDVNYARILAENTDLSLEDIILLDNVQKKKKIEQTAANRLRKLGYIEGRYPHIYISASLAEKTNSVGDYLNKKGLETRFYENLILDYLKVRSASKKELETFLIPKLSEILTDKQKKKKIGNILHRMSVKGLIVSSSKTKRAVWSKK